MKYDFSILTDRLQNMNFAAFDTSVISKDLGEKYLENGLETIVQIQGRNILLDNRFVPIITSLNDLGYRTCSCCSSHTSNELELKSELQDESLSEEKKANKAYISFNKNQPDPELFSTILDIIDEVKISLNLPEHIKWFKEHNVNVIENEDEINRLTIYFKTNDYDTSKVNDKYIERTLPLQIQEWVNSLPDYYETEEKVFSEIFERLDIIKYCGL